MKDNDFAKRVCSLVLQIPRGRVMTYGQIAALCGSAKAARIVGGIAHYGNPGLPWQRVVNRHGGLASGYHGGREAQKRSLEQEGVHVVGDSELEYRVDVKSLLWSPEIK